MPPPVTFPITVKTAVVVPPQSSSPVAIHFPSESGQIEVLSSVGHPSLNIPHSILAPQSHFLTVFNISDEPVSLQSEEELALGIPMAEEDMDIFLPWEQSAPLDESPVHPSVSPTLDSDQQVALSRLLDTYADVLATNP